MNAKFWIEMANTAAFRANNNMEGINCDNEICLKYSNGKANLASKYYEIAAYCLIRFNKCK